MTINSFTEAQHRMLARFAIEAESRFIDVPVVNGRAQVLVAGEGPPVIMVGGIGTPAAMWAPLMARLPGFHLHAVDLPGFGLTDTKRDLTRHYRATAVQFLCETLDQLGLDRAPFVASSLGSTWVLWLSLDAPERVASAVHVGCPATALGTSAPMPMRLLSVPQVGRLMMKLQPPSHKQVEQLSRMVHQHPLVPELADLLVATERLPHFEHAFLCALHTMIRLRGARPEMALSGAVLSGVQQPAQLVWGDDDPMGSTEVAHRVAKLLPDAELHVIKGGHAPWLTQADEIGVLATAFLERHGAVRHAE